jgi:ABC-2 type transport system permease protein
MCRMSDPHSANYSRVWLTFMRNALVREMTFRGNFLINLVTRGFWFFAQITLFEIIYRNVPAISDWSREQYFAFMATGMLINAIVEAFFMPNCANFSELIRTGNLDFALLKPIDTQFLISCEKMELAMVNQVILACSLLTYALIEIGEPISVLQVVAYVAFVLVGVAFFYSLMIVLASTSIWFGRNQGLYDFWFYITVFARYPRSIYDGVDPARLEAGEALQGAFTFIVPILLVVTVPAELIAKSMTSWKLPLIGLTASLAGLIASRLVFQWSLRSYRSASS